MEWESLVCIASNPWVIGIGGGILTRKSQCAVERRFLLAGAKPARQLSLQPVAVGAVHRGNDMD